MRYIERRVLDPIESALKITQVRSDPKVNGQYLAELEDGTELIFPPVFKVPAVGDYWARFTSGLVGLQSQTDFERKYISVENDAKMFVAPRA